MKGPALFDIIDFLLDLGNSLVHGIQLKCLLGKQNFHQFGVELVAGLFADGNVANRLLYAAYISAISF